MEVRVRTRYIRMTPRKIGLVLGLIRGKAVEDAVNCLMFSNKAAAKVVYKSLHSAMANAEKSKNIDTSNLYVKEAIANAGPMLKRFMPRAQGRATQILKRTSHLTITLSEI